MISLGIDVGTTHTKVLALDVASGATLALESVPTPTLGHADGQARQPLEVFEVVLSLLSRVVAALPEARAVQSLCVASVGEEVVLVDAAGRPLGETIAWYDPRGFDQARAFLAGEGGRLALSRRWPPDPTFSLFKLLWMREHRPADVDAAATWTDLGDYVLYALGGELVMDWSHASRAGAFDISARVWDAETIDLARLPLDFPRLVPSGTVLGHVGAAVARHIGLPAEVTLVSGGHDHLCAAFGAGIRSASEVFLSAGTSEAHLALLEAPIEGPAGRGIDQGCYVDDHTYYAHVNIHSGHFFKQWRELLFGHAPDDELYAEVTMASAHGMAFDVADDLRRGRLDDVPYDATRAQILRAILEGLARRSAAIIDRLEVISGSPCELVLVAGHPTRVPLWRSLRQTAYARPMAAVDEPETTAFGAAVMAAQAVAGGAADHLVASRTSWS